MIRGRNRKREEGVSFFRGKRGEEQVLPQVIFIALNILVFIILMVFVKSSSGGILVYEQAYAKQIAFVIDEAKVGMRIDLDLTEGVSIATENNVARERIIEINNGANKVSVRLSNSGGYSFYYFSDYHVIGQLDGNILRLEVKESEA